MGLLEYTLLAFVTLFVIVEPISIAPIFLAMTAGNDRSARTRTAKIACVTMVTVLLLFAVVGMSLLEFFGISVAAFQTSGGILLLLIALDMLQAKESSRKITQEESDAGTAKEDIAITPLAVPLLAGPGAITTCIVLANQAEAWDQRMALYGVIIFICGLTFLILKLADKGAAWMNPLFMRVITRLAGLLLAALAVQFIFNGLRDSGLFPLSGGAL
ncbi:conserved hypothetical protein TIGR00427 [Verrucomicrobiia bacterium DG1235]|nr:conserved hypothetical protein TIGR00427 [Verrucomicrobiae bacterium DG1235]